MNTVAHAQEACGIMKKAKMGAQTVATSAASEETLKPNAMTSQTKAQSRAVAGERASKNAQCGGYAFAAFKIENIGHIWPTNAAMATSAIVASDKFKASCRQRAKMTATKPFTASAEQGQCGRFFLTAAQDVGGTGVAGAVSARIVHAVIF